LDPLDAHAGDRMIRDAARASERTIGAYATV
jgi:hypothetical protein